MARRSRGPEPPPESPLTLRVARDRAEEILDQQEAKGRELLEAAGAVQTSDAYSAWHDDYTRWIKFTETALDSIYSAAKPSEEFERTATPGVYVPDDGRQFEIDQNALRRGVNDLVSLKERLAFIGSASPPGMSPTRDQSQGSGSVFVVHGHNDRIKTQVARLLERAGDHEVVILHEQTDRGRTVIEKFEDHAAASGFAVILLTGDDVGGPKDSGATQPRARQNVVFEFGYFAAALGRRNVVVLHEEGVELPSDVHGLLYKPLDSGGAWQYALLKELKAAGFSYSLDRA